MEDIKNIYTQIKNGIYNTTEKLRGYIIVNKNGSNLDQDYEEDQYENNRYQQELYYYMNYLCCFVFVILIIYLIMSMADSNEPSRLRREIMEYDTTEVPNFYRNSYPLERINI